MAGPPASRAIRATTAARLPPALSPPTARRLGVHAQLGGMGDDPARGRPGVVGGGGEFVLGGQAIVHRDHAGAGLRGELPAEDVMRLQIADHPAAAVEVDVDRQPRGVGHSRRPVEAERDLTRRALGGEVPYRADGGRGRASRRGASRRKS